MLWDQGQWSFSGATQSAASVSAEELKCLILWRQVFMSESTGQNQWGMNSALGSSPLWEAYQRHAGLPPRPQHNPWTQVILHSIILLCAASCCKIKIELSVCLQVSNIYRLMSLLHCLSAKRNTFSSFSFPFKANSSIQIIFLVLFKILCFCITF